MMPGVNVIGQDEPHPCPNASAGNAPLQCQAACKAKAGCVAWTLHYNSPIKKAAPGWRCCTKVTYVSLQHADSNTTSGILHPPAMANAKAALRLTGPLPKVIVATTASTPGGTMDAAAAGIAFSEFYDLRADPWQMQNLWPTLSAGRKAALMAEIDRRFACAGTRTTPSTCE